jgi:hypothetical protein
VVLEPSETDWLCERCGAGYAVPPGSRSAVYCADCMQPMTPRLVPVALTCGPEADLVRRPADDGMSLAVSPEGLAQLAHEQAWTYSPASPVVIPAGGSFSFTVPAQSYAELAAEQAGLLSDGRPEPLTLAEIARLLACNQTVTDAARALILNHSAPFPDEEGEIPWRDSATWSPGDTEL